MKRPRTTVEDKQKQKKRRKATPKAAALAQDQELVSATSDDSTKGHVVRLDVSQLPVAQRQNLAAQIGQTQENRYLQRVIATSNMGPRLPAVTVVQREETERRFQLSSPSLLQSGAQPPSGLFGDRLQLDPAILAQIQAIEFMLQQLEPTKIKTSLAELVPSLPPPTPAPQAQPVPSPSPLPLPTSSSPSSSSTRQPLVPAGAGPSTPRPGTIGDIINAITKIPAVDEAITNLRMQAVERVKRYWRQLSTGEQVAAVSVATLIGGGTLAGVLAHPGNRQTALEQLNGRVLPVPGINGLGVELNTAGDNLMLGLHLDVGTLLPPSLGFGPSSPQPIGAPPRQ